LVTLTGALSKGTGVLAAGALAVAVLAGCSSDSDTDTTAPAASASTSAAGGGYGGGGGVATTAPEASAAETGAPPASDPIAAGALTIDDFAFSPANPTFAVGQEVVVTNNDTVAHTWTSEDGGFDTGLIQPGSSASVTLTKAGTFDFVCTPHAAVMTGVVTVTG
jgi:plastocyanin